MLTLKTNALTMTVFLTLSMISYSDYFASKSCVNQYSSYLNSSDQCYSNNLSLEEFSPTFPH